MKHNYTKTPFTIVAVLLLTLSGFAQRNNYWTSVDATKAQASEQIFRKAHPFQAYYYALNIDALKNAVQFAPQRLNGFKCANSFT